MANFVGDGFLQEVNRRYFHVLGLALSVDSDGRLGLIDHRDDPEGMIFGDLLDTDDSRVKAANVEADWNARAGARLRALGFIVEPVPYRKEGA